MRSRLLQRFRLSTRTQRRLERYGAAVRRLLGYPFGRVMALTRAVAGVIGTWWESRNLRFLLQGLPSFILAIGLVVLSAVFYFQDRALLARQYQDQGFRSLYDADQAIRANKDGKAAVALAQTCYKRLSRLQPGRDENN